MTINLATRDDGEAWLGMRRELWPDSRDEQWARARGCSEFASDSQPDNVASSAAHVALSFKDEGLVRCFSKKI